MARVKVYQYDYFDTLLKRDRRSVDFATADAIAEMGGTILAETERSVDEDLLDEAGVIRAAKLPPREDVIDLEEMREEPFGRNPPAPPGEQRLGPG